MLVLPPCPLLLLLLVLPLSPCPLLLLLLVLLSPCPLLLLLLVMLLSHCPVLLPLFMVLLSPCSLLLPLLVLLLSPHYLHYVDVLLHCLVLCCTHFSLHVESSGPRPSSTQVPGASRHLSSVVNHVFCSIPYQMI